MCLHTHTHTHCFNIFCYNFYFIIEWAESGGISPWPGWLTIVLQCYDINGWIIRLIKSLKWTVIFGVNIKPCFTVTLTTTFQLHLFRPFSSWFSYFYLLQTSATHLNCSYSRHFLLSKHTWSHISSTYLFLQFDCIIDYFLYRALEAACTAYTSLKSVILHYIP